MRDMNNLKTRKFESDRRCALNDMCPLRAAIGVSVKRSLNLRTDDSFSE